MWNEKENILNYINDNFNIDKTSYLLISELFDFIYHKCSGKVKVHLYKKNYESCYINYYITELVDMLNNADIDITIQELVENDIIEH